MRDRAAPPAWVASLPLVGSRLAAYWNPLSESSADRLSEIVKWLPTVQKAVLGTGRALGAGVFQIALNLLRVFSLTAGASSARRSPTHKFASSRWLFAQSKTDALNGQASRIR